MRDDEIAKLLGITERTVRFHIDSMKLKLSANSRMQAIAKAIQKRPISV
jgi:DNA-binding CsgD family transcriptional regulator